MKIKWILFGILFSISTAFSQSTNVPDLLLDSLINQAREAKRLVSALKVAQKRILQDSINIQNADSSILWWKTAFEREKLISAKTEEQFQLTKKINLIYESRADFGNKAVTSAAVGLGFYMAGGEFREPKYTIGSIIISYGIFELFGAPFDIFTVDLNPFF